MEDAELFSRKVYATQILRTDLGVQAARPLAAQGGPRGLPIIDWQSTGVDHLTPTVVPTPVPEAYHPLPPADAVVITWTSAEWDALHYVFSTELGALPKDPDNNKSWRKKWHLYARDFYTAQQTLWTRRLISANRNVPLGAPALTSGGWGRYCLVTVGGLRVLLFKSDLHLNQDGEQLPLLRLCRQIIVDSRPQLILSIGTAGGVQTQHILGDVVVTARAKFRLSDEFENAVFNGRLYQDSSWTPSLQYLDQAHQLLMDVPEFPVQPPTARYPDGAQIRPRSERRPQVHVTEAPILTTDFFEYGTTTNGLDQEGCCVEMDDAVVAMACQTSRPDLEYGFVRNVSDPVINGHLHPSLQTAWAVCTYQKSGLFTSFNGAVATWALLAGRSKGA